MPKSNAIRPITSETELGLFSFWESTFRSGEICSTFFYPISGNNYRLVDFLDWYRKRNGVSPLLVNLSTTNTEEVEDLKKLFTKARHGLIVKPAESLVLPHMKKSFHNYLNWNNKHKKGALMIFEGFIDSIFSSIEASEFHDAFQHTHFFPLLSLPDTAQFISHLRAKYGWKKSNLDIEKIYAETGGHTWLIKEIVRESALGRSFEEIITSTQYKYKCKTIFDRIPEKLRCVFNNLIAGEDVDASSSSFVALHQLGFIKNNRNIWTVPRFVKEQSIAKMGRLEIRDERLIHNQIDVSAYFSVQECIFLKTVIATQGFQTREFIAKLIWPNGNYSDWTFDQLVKRVRNKFIKIGLSPKLIVTKRGRGIKYESK